MVYGEMFYVYLLSIKNESFAGFSKLLVSLGHTGRKSFLGPHIKYIVTRNHKANLIVF